jgi:chromosome segregation ATPase
MISRLIGLLSDLVEFVVDALETGGENRKRREFKRLAIEEIRLTKLLATVQQWLQEAQAKPVIRVGGRYINPRQVIPGHQRNIRELQRQMDKLRRRQQHITRALGGKLDEEPAPARRSLGEVLGDVFASLSPANLRNRVFQLEGLAESLTAHIEAVKVERESDKLRMYEKSYFAHDRELVRLRAQLRKTEGRIATLREKPAFA